jgi:hypothetical protein
MKGTLILLGTALLAHCSANAQSILPEPLPQPPSNSNFYYQNQGQIIDNLGNVRDDIKYYTEKTFPAMFLMEDRISFVASQSADTAVVGAEDSLYRIDMQFLCGSDGLISKPSSTPSGPITLVPPTTDCGDIAAYEPGDDHLNYYLPHCPERDRKCAGLCADRL